MLWYTVSDRDNSCFPCGCLCHGFHLAQDLGQVQTFAYRVSCVQVVSAIAVASLNDVVSFLIGPTAGKFSTLLRVRKTCRWLAEGVGPNSRRSPPSVLCFSTGPCFAFGDLACCCPPSLRGVLLGPFWCCMCSCIFDPRVFLHIGLHM